MARQKRNTTRTSLYHLLQVAELRTAIRPKYLEPPYSFVSLEHELEGRSALLVTGEMVKDRATWADTVEKLTGATIAVGNKTAAGVLLIRDGEHDAWALSYGMGFQVLNQDLFDAAFGQRIALRSVDVAELSSLTRTTLDSRAHVDRLSIPSGDHLRNFGLSDFGELVTRVVAKASITGLTDAAEKVTLRGADALQLPLANKPSALLADLDLLASLLKQPPMQGLELLEQVSLVKHDPELIRQLDDRLEHALANPENSRIAVAWPHEQLDENSTPAGFTFQNAGRGHSGQSERLPTLADLLAPLASVADGDRLQRLKRMKIVLTGDVGASADGAVSSAIPAIRWVAFEVDHESRRYFLHNGSWYLVDHAYVTRLKKQTKAILERDAQIDMPEWTSDLEDEKAYNIAAAAALGAVNLDRKLIRTSFHRYGIEPCDLLMPDGTMIHVKMLHGSDAASHLIAQALVSSDALLHDNEAVVQLAQRTEGLDVILPTARSPKKVVLAMARDGGITEDTLFTFTQVTLVRNVQALQRQGIEVYIASIHRAKTK